MTVTTILAIVCILNSIAGIIGAKCVLMLHERISAVEQDPHLAVRTVRW